MLAFEHGMTRCVEAGIRFFHIHSDPFLRAGFDRMGRLASGDGR